MVVTTQRKKIEILVDRPLLKRLRDIADNMKLSGYTILPTIGGQGGKGRWREDHVTGGAGSKVIFMSIIDEDTSNQLLEEIRPLLDDYSLMVTITNVEVIRAARF